MEGALQQVLTYTAFPVLAALIGSVAAAVREPGVGLRRALQHLAAGVVFATAALELLPEVKEGSAVAVIVGFALGLGVMLGLKSMTRRMEKVGGESQLPTGLLAATGVDLLIDGLVLAIGFAAAAATGLVLAIALALELLVISVAVAATLRDRGVPPIWVVAVPTGLTLLIPLGAVGGTTALAGVSAHDLAGVLAFGAVALLYLVTEELLAEGHSEDESPLATAMFFIGVLVFLVLDMVTE